MMLIIRKGDYVLYWMQQSQRAEYNHALEYAVQQANKLGQVLLVVFGLMDDYPEANLRHYTFMLEGLQETQAALASRGIKMVLRRGHPPEVALELGQRASMIVCDRGYLRHQRAWRRQVAQSGLPCRSGGKRCGGAAWRWYPTKPSMPPAPFAPKYMAPRRLSCWYSSDQVEHPSLELKIKGD